MMHYDFSVFGGSNNEYVFITDFDISYIIQFKPTPYLPFVTHPENVYEFVIGILNNPNKSKTPLDSKIGLTVAKIFNDFFEKNNNVVSIFICESSDKKQDLRMKKFDQWFNKYQDSSFLKLDEVLIDKNNNRFPISIILKNTNPNRLEIFEAFINITNLHNQDK